MGRRFELKRLSKVSVSSSLDKALKYRLLNEPLEAESVCLDVLDVDVDNQKAVVTLILSLTDQFGAEGFGSAERRARELLARLGGDYEKSYYAGIISEKRAKAQKLLGTRTADVIGSLEEAMEHYAAAETIQAEGEGGHDAVLRWNACARQIMRLEN